MLITTVDCLILGLSIACLSISLDGRYNWREFICIWGIAFITDMMFCGVLEQYSLLAVIAALTIYKVFIKKERAAIALFLNNTTIICALACVLFCSSPFTLFFPDFVGTLGYEITIGILQLLAALGLSVALKDFRTLTFQSGKTMRKVTAAQITFLLLYTVIMPLLYFLPNMEQKNYLIVYSAFSLFIMGMAVFSVFFIHSAFQAERNYIHAQNDLNNMEQFWEQAVTNDHTLMGLYRSMEKYISNDNFEGLKEYFAKYITPTVCGKVSDEISNLENIISPLIQNILSEKFTLAKSLGISIDIEIIGTIEPNISEHDLFQVLNIYLDNAINSCSEQKEHGKVGVILSEGHDAVHILIKNTVAADTDSLGALLSQRRNSDRYSLHGNGMNIVEKVLKKYDNVLKHMFLEDGEFTILLYIGDTEEC